MTNDTSWYSWELYQSYVVKGKGKVAYQAMKAYKGGRNVASH